MVTDDDEVGGPPLRGVVEVEWEGWDEERPRSRTPWIVGGALAAATVVVAGLVVWATSTDTELVVPTTTTVVPDGSTPVPSDSPVEPTLEALEASLPRGLDGCVPTAEPPAPGTVGVACPGDGVPELVTVTLFRDEDARDRAFADTVASLELDPGGPGDCALADDAVHGYVGARGRGRVACRSVDQRVDIAWTDGSAPLLAVAGGFGSRAAHYRFWADLVERSDAEFPLPLEQALLDEVPRELQSRCERDLGLLEDARGLVAVTCRPATGAAGTVSWVRFGDADAMTAWIDGRRRALGEAVADTSDRACGSDGPGPNGELPPPWLGTSPYQLDGTTGRVLCTVDASGEGVLVWTRAGSNIGSVARAVDVLELVTWWEAGGHRP